MRLIDWLLFGRRVLDYVPSWLRHHGPLRRYYWQADEVEAVEAQAAEWANTFGINATPEEQLILDGKAIAGPLAPPEGPR